MNAEKYAKIMLDMIKGSKDVIEQAAEILKANVLGTENKTERETMLEEYLEKIIERSTFLGGAVSDFCAMFYKDMMVNDYGIDTNDMDMILKTSITKTKN